MKPTSHHISSRERYLVVGFAAALCIFVILQIGSEELQNYDYWSLKEQTRQAGQQGTMIDFGPPGYRTPGLHIFSFVVLLATCFGKKYIVAMAATLIYLSLVLIGIYQRYQSFDSDFAINATLCQLIWLSAYPIDYVALLFLGSLTIWFLSIYWRFGFKDQSFR